jgi:hypothetical protein
MTFERTPGLGPEPVPNPPPTDEAAPAVKDAGTGDSAGRHATPVQIRLQILTTEHWSLLASRGLAWNEAFARAGMYLSTLSATLVALGLIGGIDGFGDVFFTFAFVVLPVALFIGIGAWLRMSVSNYHEAQTVFGMNRIRGAYLEIAPDLEPYFVMGVHDDPAGIGITMAIPSGRPTWVHLISSTPFLVVTLNAVVAGAIAALVLVRFVVAPATLVVLGAIVVAVVVLLAEMSVARRSIEVGQRSVRPLFPTPETPNQPAPREIR